MSKKLAESVQRLRKELINQYWMWNFSWRGVKLETLETCMVCPNRIFYLFSIPQVLLLLHLV